MKIEKGIQLRPTLDQSERLQKQDDQLRQAAKMYEQHFMREMVKAMRQAVPEGGLLEKSMGEKIFSEQLDNQYVEQWSDKGGVGLADMIHAHIKERFFPKGPSPEAPKGPLPLDKKNGIQWKAEEPKGGSIQFKSDSAMAPTDREVRAPWPGQVGAVFSTPEGISSVEIKHDQSLVSRIVFPGDVKGLREGQEVQSGAKLGAIDAAAPWLQWHLVRA